MISQPPVPVPDSKLPHVGASIFSVMSRMAAEHNAINLAQGFPDFAISAELMDHVAQAMQAGFNQYAPVEGVLALRERIAEKTERLYGYAPHPQAEITVTTGATEAIYAIISAVVQPGDEVIVLEPCYDSYLPAIALNHGVAVPVSLSPDAYATDWDAVQRAITPRTRLIMLNSPHNPSGSVFTDHDLQRLTELVRDTSILILSDEVYEHLIFDGQPHCSVLRVPELRERSFVLSSFGKTFHTTGWRLGYCVAPPALTTELRKVHQFITFAATTPLQHGVAAYLANPAHYEGLPAFYQEKRDCFARLMGQTRFQLLPCRGSYFQLASYQAISDEPDTVFAERLTREVGVACIPVSAFYQDRTDHHVVRFCFAKKAETLEAAVERLVRAGL